jgi:hypothetical protein
VEIDGRVDGKKAFLDRSNHSITVDKNCGDCVRRARCGVKDSAIPDIEPFEIVLPGCHVTPEVALEMSKKILGGRKAAPAKLTVGDLSVVNEPKRKNRVQDGMRYLRDREKGLTVGDRSVVRQDQRGLKDLFVGPAAPKSNTSPSQEVLMGMQRKQWEKIDEVARIKQIMFEQARTDKIRREVARQGLKI